MTLWPKKWSRSLKKFERRSLTREFLNLYLKSNGYLQRSCLWEVVAYGVTAYEVIAYEVVAYVDCSSNSIRQNK